MQYHSNVPIRFDESHFFFHLNVDNFFTYLFFFQHKGLFVLCNFYTKTDLKDELPEIDLQASELDFLFFI